MDDFPPPSGIEEAAPGLFEEGHLWIQERVDGGLLRFSLRGTGAVRFGDAETVFEPGDVPLPYRRSVRHVRRNLDREALRAAVDDPEAVTFFGRATYRNRVDYDWNRLPPFLGFAVRSSGAFLPPDAVEAIYERLGLRPVNAVRKEVKARDFTPAEYEVPTSAWRDGPALGVVFRDKNGRRAEVLHPSFRGDGDIPENDVTGAELARECIESAELDRIVARLRERGDPVEVETVVERVLDEAARRAGRRLAGVDPGAFRSEVAASVRRFVDDA